MLFVNFDKGGEGVAYHDEDPFAGNTNGFRTTERVDMEPSPTGGYNVAYTRQGILVLHFEDEAYVMFL